MYSDSWLTTLVWTDVSWDFTWLTTSEAKIKMAKKLKTDDIIEKGLFAQSIEETNKFLGELFFVRKVFDVLQKMCWVAHNYNVYRKDEGLTKYVVKHMMKRTSHDLQWYIGDICVVWLYICFIQRVEMVYSFARPAERI